MDSSTSTRLYQLVLIWQRFDDLYCSNSIAPYQYQHPICHIELPSTTSMRPGCSSISANALREEALALANDHHSFSWSWEQDTEINSWSWANLSTACNYNYNYNCSSDRRIMMHLMVICERVLVATATMTIVAEAIWTQFILLRKAKATWTELLNW